MKGWRKIVVDGRAWRWRCGKGTVEARSVMECGGAYVFTGEVRKVDAHVIVGVTHDTYDRGKWKVTSDGMVCPRHVANWLRYGVEPASEDRVRAMALRCAGKRGQRLPPDELKFLEGLLARYPYWYWQTEARVFNETVPAGSSARMDEAPPATELVSVDPEKTIVPGERQVGVDLDKFQADTLNQISLAVGIPVQPPKPEEQP